MVRADDDDDDDDETIPETGTCEGTGAARDSGDVPLVVCVKPEEGVPPEGGGVVDGERAGEGDDENDAIAEMGT